MLRETNLDGLVGPSHHYGGLGFGNLASQRHQGQVAHPKAAALQGLDKLSRIAKLGIPQAILPPQQRPYYSLLRDCGFRGTNHELLQAAAEEAPHLLSAVCSASAMWTANAATISPASDTQDGRTHLSIANLVSSLHRSLEPPQTWSDLQYLFHDKSRFCVHPALPHGFSLRDEGAANHMRICSDNHRRAIHLFVGGDLDDPSRSTTDSLNPSPRFLPRQSQQAFACIARRHGLDPDLVFYLQQHPRAISHGAFHNDVVATSCQNVVLHHEYAFANDEAAWLAIERRFQEVTGQPLQRIVINDSELPLAEAIACYLFNSQLIHLPSPETPHALVLICPMQCAESSLARTVIDRLQDQLPQLQRVEFVELRESMQNGGGPACLRLRVSMTAADQARTLQDCWWSERLEDDLRDCIQRLYPDTQSIEDLSDPMRVEQWSVAINRVRTLLGW